MNINFEVEENNAVVMRAKRDVASADPASNIFSSVAAEIGVDRAALLKEVGIRDDEMELKQFLEKGEEREVKIKRVCVDLHFESEHETHKFLSRQTWGDVHKFGCNKFHVAGDACANLELHEGTPTGPVLNDRLEIGTFEGCKEVWMVKPGPEPNGATNGTH